MGHDKLLASIDSWIAIPETIKGDRKTWKALRAVVELHKPWTATENDRYWGEFRNELGEQRCPACTMPSAYPCPTIQAIEKELN